jgi:hypothetical protein
MTAHLIVPITTPIPPPNTVRSADCLRLHELCKIHVTFTTIRFYFKKWFTNVSHLSRSPAFLKFSFINRANRLRRSGFIMLTHFLGLWISLREGRLVVRREELGYRAEARQRGYSNSLGCFSNGLLSQQPGLPNKSTAEYVIILIRSAAASPNLPLVLFSNVKNTVQMHSIYSLHPRRTD